MQLAGVARTGFQRGMAEVVASRLVAGAPRRLSLAANALNSRATPQSSLTSSQLAMMTTTVVAPRFPSSRCFHSTTRSPTLRDAAITTEAVDTPATVPIPKANEERKIVTRSQSPPPGLKDLKMGFVGWGAMAQAMSLGVLRKGLTSSKQMMVIDLEPKIMEEAEKEGLQTAHEIKGLVEWADIVVVAVKPQVIENVMPVVAPHWSQEKLLVSICAGVTIDTYLRGLPKYAEDAKVVRVMPNTSLLVGESATAFAGSDSCAEWELDLVHGMFGAIGGATHRVPEYLLNAVTGLSGSGPAYVYMLIQALSDAGVHGGLPRAVALSLATQTVIGAAKMVQETGQHPAVLKEAVTSPAGTTIAGVRVLERMGFNGAVIEAVEGARLRSEELSKTPDFLYQEKRVKGGSLETP